MSTASRESAAVTVASPPRRLDRGRTVGDLVTQWLLPLIAIGLLGFAGWFVWRTRPVTGDPPPPIAPAVNPYAAALAAAGIVEAQTENIAAGSATPGVVVEVLVNVGDDVQPGRPLFRLDDRDLRAELAVRKAEVERAKTDLVRLEAEPRPEKIPVQAAAVREAQSLLAREQDALKRARETFAQRVTTEEDLIAKQQAVRFAEASVARAQADLDLLEAGSWRYDLDVSRAAVKRAEAEAAHIETALDRLVVRALVAGRVLQVNVRPGEFVGAPPNQPLVVLGNIEKLHVRVDVDEYDIARFDQAASATAFPRGSLQQRYPLEFVRVEPFVVPKKSLTGDTTERVDTRVLQVIYEFDPAGRPPLFVGQQVDVYIDAASR
ncbi:MAG: HlyD family efflux transporter periplasmic adaptor subunit [Planctomycetaceae bacterium]|jgi:multidrug efflux pump subunit AcrA (membrane-fusion protein)|nr:HlyD family efflux transporter periplasmic adaptor subunit [Planctomycetaceae bacterium]